VKFGDSKTLLSEAAQALAPRDRPDIISWCEEHRVVSEHNREAGAWRCVCTPYLGDILRAAVSDPLTVVMGAAQIGKTDGLLINLCCYRIAHAPAPMLIVQDTLASAETLTRRLSAAFRDSAVMRKLVDPTPHDAAGTFRFDFDQGYLVLVGSHSPSGLSQHPIPYVIFDDADRCVPEVTNKEGSPVDLAIRRASTWGTESRILLLSSPTISGSSVIERYFFDGTHDRWLNRCPACSRPQLLAIDELEISSGLLRCTACGQASNQLQWQRGRGAWQADSPGARHRSFSLSQMAAPLVSWSTIGQAYLDAVADKNRGDLRKLRSVVCTVFGRPWELWRKRPGAAARLLERRETYGAECPASDPTICRSLEDNAET
jgi:phage terminase large subunit GpA-like protein